MTTFRSSAGFVGAIFFKNIVAIYHGTFTVSSLATEETMRRKGRVPQINMGTALFLLAVMSLQPNTAHADVWGCEVLLCMSNPAGPEAVSQCVPPMQTFYDVLKHGGSRPTCPASGWSGNIGYQPLACPDGFDLTQRDVEQGLQPVCESATGVTRPAEQRSQPYYVDIPRTDGQPGLQRIWLSEH